MTSELYTVEELAEEMGESEEDIKESLQGLEDEGVVHCVDGEHWDIVNYRRMMAYFMKHPKETINAIRYNE